MLFYQKPVTMNILWCLSVIFLPGRKMASSSLIAEKPLTSLVDRDRPPPIVVKADFTDEFVILGVMLIIILGFWIWVMFMVRYSTPAPKYFLKCDPGKCSTNIQTGEKKCNTDPNIPVIYDPAYEICNSKFACDNLLTPYAVQNDGSTDISGVCESGTICRCVKQSQCGYETIVGFSSINGSVYKFDDTSVENRLILYQVSLTGQSDVGTPVQIDNPANNFCMIKARNLDRVVPRTRECSIFVTASDPTLAEASACILSNPCTIGRLAFRPYDVKDFVYNQTTLNDIPVGCVPLIKGQGECVAPQVPVWDPSRAGVVCL